jgi:hypothetical protein
MPAQHFSDQVVVQLSVILPIFLINLSSQPHSNLSSKASIKTDEHVESVDPSLVTTELTINKRTFQCSSTKFWLL